MDQFRARKDDGGMMRQFKCLKMRSDGGTGAAYRSYFYWDARPIQGEKGRTTMRAYVLAYFWFPKILAAQEEEKSNLRGSTIGWERRAVVRSGTAHHRRGGSFRHVSGPARPSNREKRG